MVDVEVYGKMLSTLPPGDDHPYRSGPCGRRASSTTRTSCKW